MISHFADKRVHATFCTHHIALVRCMLMSTRLHFPFFRFQKLNFCSASAKMDPARFRAASAKLETDPYDLDAWSLVIKEAQAKVVRIVIF